MAIKQVTMWEDSAGVRHETEAKAKDAESKIKLLKAMTKLAERDYTVSESNMIVQFILLNCYTILSIMRGEEDVA